MVLWQSTQLIHDWVDWIQVKAINKGKPEQTDNANHGNTAQNNLRICFERAKVLPLISPGTHPHHWQSPEDITTQAACLEWAC